MVRKGWEETLKKGQLGESFLKWYCVEAKNITYKKASEEENLHSGIDAWIEGVGSDVKNTNKIYLGKYSLKYEKFFVRHPFRENTKCTNYIILDMDEKSSKFGIKYNGEIKAYLTNKYFKGPDELEAAIKLLQSFEKKDFEELGFRSIDQMLIDTKKKFLKNFLQPSVYCGYNSVSDGVKFGENELPLYLLHYDDRDERYDR